MNKYFIGFSLPEDHHIKLRKAQQLVRDQLAPTTRVLPTEEFHVTSLFLGKCPRAAAEDVCGALAWGLGSIYFRFVGFTAFSGSKGPHALVMKLHDLYGNAEAMHRMLTEAAVAHPAIKLEGKRWGYNPHVTIAKCEGAPDAALPEAAKNINEKMHHNAHGHEFHCDHLVLFEKVEGTTAYEPHRVLQLR